MSRHTELRGRRGVIAAVVTLACAGIAAMLAAASMALGASMPEASTPESGSPPASATDGQEAQPALSRSAPVGLAIPAINLDVGSDRIVPLGLTEDQHLEVPESPKVVGWYKLGPTPGQAGPAIMAGHVDSDAGPAVFYRLHELQPGDTVKVARADGKTAVFTVYEVASYPKDEFPTEKVYGETGGRAELRLITCGGSFNEETQHYSMNIVAYARLTGVSSS